MARPWSEVRWAVAEARGEAAAAGTELRGRREEREREREKMQKKLLASRPLSAHTPFQFRRVFFLFFAHRASRASAQEHLPPSESQVDFELLYEVLFSSLRVDLSMEHIQSSRRQCFDSHHHHRRRRHDDSRSARRTFRCFFNRPPLPSPRCHIPSVLPRDGSS